MTADFHEHRHTVRLNDEEERRLAEASQRDGIAPSVLCRKFIRDGLRMDEISRRQFPADEVRFSQKRH